MDGCEQDFSGYDEYGQAMYRNTGTVTDYSTGTAIRPATGEEWLRTATKLLEERPGSYTGAWDDSDGCAVYVDGGPDMDITPEDIRQLRDEAGTAGDDKQVRLCTIALREADEDDLDASDPDAAWYECGTVILATRLEMAA